MTCLNFFKHFSCLPVRIVSFIPESVRNLRKSKGGWASSCTYVYIHAASNILTENIVLMYLIICCAIELAAGALVFHSSCPPRSLTQHTHTTHAGQLLYVAIATAHGSMCCAAAEQRAAQCANMLLQRLRDPTETVKRQKRITTSSVHFLSRDDKYAVMIENTMTWKINRTFHYW